MDTEEFFKDKKFSNVVFKVIESSFNNKHRELKMKLLPYTSEKKILSDFKKEKIPLIILSPESYFNNETSLKKISSKKWTIRFNKEKYEQYYLLANKNSNASIKNIKNYRVNFRDGIFSSQRWFESLIYKEHKKPYKTLVKKSFYFKKRSKLIYEVFFNKDSVSIVNKNDFDTLLEINPQLKKNIKIIKKSRRIFLSFIGISHKNIKKERENFIFNHVTNIDSIIVSEHSLSLQSLSKVYLLKDADLLQLRRFYKEYKILKTYEK